MRLPMYLADGTHYRNVLSIRLAGTVGETSQEPTVLTRAASLKNQKPCKPCAP